GWCRREMSWGRVRVDVTRCRAISCPTAIQGSPFSAENDTGPVRGHGAGVRTDVNLPVREVESERWFRLRPEATWRRRESRPPDKHRNLRPQRGLRRLGRLRYRAMNMHSLFPTAGFGLSSEGSIPRASASGQ